MLVPLFYHSCKMCEEYEVRYGTTTCVYLSGQKEADCIDFVAFEAFLPGGPWPAIQFNKTICCGTYIRPSDTTIWYNHLIRHVRYPCGPASAT